MTINNPFVPTLDVSLSNTLSDPAIKDVSTNLISASEFFGEMFLQIGGFGDPVSTHDSDVYAIDYEEIFRKYSSNEPVWRHGRKVENLLSTSEPTPIGLEPQGTVSNLGDGSYVLELSQNENSFRFGAITTLFSTLVCRVNIKTVSGTSSVSISVGGQNLTSISVDSEWKIFTNSTDSPSGDYFDLVINGNIGDKIQIRIPQLQSKPGSSIWNIPDEYVYPGSFKIFNYYNGNTIDSNILTEINGDRFVVNPELVYSPEQENVCLYSNNLTDSSWINVGSPIISFDQNGLTEEPNTASYIEDDTILSSDGVYQDISISANTNIHVARYFIKKDSDETRFVGLELTLLPEDTLYCRIHLNTKTGETIVVSSLGTVEQESISFGNYWAVLISVQNTSNTSARLRIYPAVGIVFGTNTFDAVGSCIVGNCGLFLNKIIPEIRYLTPIFTTSTPEIVDSTNYIFDSLNYTDGEGAIYLEIIPTLSHDENSILGQQRIIEYIIGTDSNGNFETTDSSIALTGDEYFYSPIEMVRLGLVYSEDNNIRSIKVNDIEIEDTYTSPFIYDTLIRLFYLYKSTTYIRNLYFLEGGSYNMRKTKIDILMSGNLDFRYINNSQYITII